MTLERTGLLIVFEGTDGTGKSTQLQLLARTLTEKGFDVISSREPTEGKYGQQIRALYSDRDSVSREEELALFLADRKEHVDTLLTPALSSGKIVLCDRYFLSTIAYQGAAGMDTGQIIEKNAFAPNPDICLLFHASIQTGVDRITSGRGEELNDFEKTDYLQKVASIFDKMDFPYIHRINAAQSIEDVALDVLTAIEPHLVKLP